MSVWHWLGIVLWTAIVLNRGFRFKVQVQDLAHWETLPYLRVGTSIWQSLAMGLAVVHHSASQMQELGRYHRVQSAVELLAYLPTNESLPDDGRSKAKLEGRRRTRCAHSK